MEPLKTGLIKLASSSTELAFAIVQTVTWLLKTSLSRLRQAKRLELWVELVRASPRFLWHLLESWSLIQAR